MARVQIQPTEWVTRPGLAGYVYEHLVDEGLLIAAQDANGRLNPMTIGWGVFGAIWGRPMFVVLVRPSRYTFDCLEHSGDFTVNVMPAEQRHVVAHCGGHSGRDGDKLEATGVHACPSTKISSGGIAEASVIIECRTAHFNDVQGPQLGEAITSNYYPDGDFHRVYFGEVLAVAAEEELLVHG